MKYLNTKGFTFHISYSYKWVGGIILIIADLSGGVYTGV